jgi:mannose-1-phosphate guanylyltransferase/mannose-6-phosphate isomerase
VPVLLIEVQHGPYLGEDDIIRRQDDYGRAAPGVTRPVKSKKR